MMVSVTEWESWHRCRRKRQLTSLNTTAYTAIWPKMNTLGLGSLVHHAGEAWLQSPNPTSTPTMFSDLFYEAGKRFYKELLVVCEKTNYRHTDRQDNEFWEAVTLGRHMCQNYQDYYHQPLPDGYELVRPEQQCVVPIPGTVHCECVWPCTEECMRCLSSAECCVYNHTDYACSCKIQPHYLEGTLDAIIGDSAGRLFVYERKTFGQHPNIDHLNRTQQFTAYSWILTQLVAHWGTSNEVAGVLYDGLWKRTNPPTTGKWKDNRDSLFLRHYLIHNDDKLAEFQAELASDVFDMANPDTFITHTVPAVKGCIDCDLVDVCDRMSNGEDTTLLLRTNYTRRNLTPAFKEFYSIATETE